jgi:mRNA interferase YafQ
MRTTKPIGKFKKDYKRVKACSYHKDIDELLSQILFLLVENKELPDKYKDHDLTGNWRDHRECHIKPDLLLIYSKPNKDTLYLVRLGSHSELFK